MPTQPIIGHRGSIPRARGIEASLLAGFTNFNTEGSIVVAGLLTVLSGIVPLHIRRCRCNTRGADSARLCVAVAMSSRATRALLLTTLLCWTAACVLAAEAPAPAPGPSSESTAAPAADLCQARMRLPPAEYWCCVPLQTQACKRRFSTLDLKCLLLCRLRRAQPQPRRRLWRTQRDRLLQALRSRYQQQHHQPADSCWWWQPAQPEVSHHTGMRTYCVRSAQYLTLMSKLAVAAMMRSAAWCLQ